MVSIVFCLRRLPTITSEQFSTYWHDRHAPLFAGYAAALRVTRYVQLHRLATPFDDALQASRGTAAGFDGVAQVWFATMADLTAGLTGLEGRAAGAALIADEQAFIDHGSSAIWVAGEREIHL